VARNKLRELKMIEGGGRFKCPGQGREIDQLKASGGDVLFLVTIYLCHAVAKLPDDAQLGVRRDGLVINVK